MVDNLSKVAMEKYVYRCFGKSSINGSCFTKDFVDITENKNNIYFSTMYNLHFVFKKDGCNEFILYMGVNNQIGLYFKGCELIRRLSTYKFMCKEFTYTHFFDEKCYLFLQKNFNVEEILNIIDNPKEIIFDFEGNSLNVFEVYPDTIGQFIGICDKNVKEIYRDDIVIYNHNENIIRGIVVFKDLAYQIKYKDQDMFDAYLRLFDWSGEFIEVIGNIHENPESL